jgi:hypothetical protein
MADLVPDGFRKRYARPIHLFTRVLSFLYVWLCFIKVPLTPSRPAPEQSWEAVLSYGTAHQLQWGRDLVFTFGPLGFLTSDHYWGSMLVPILIWAMAFALVLSVAAHLFLKRLPGSMRLVFYVALPLLTTPSCRDLGFDPIYLLAVTLLSVACLAEEKPSQATLVVTGCAFAVVSLIKLTFGVYAMLGLSIIVVEHCVLRRWRNASILVSTFLLSLLISGLLTGQEIPSLAMYFSRGAIMASGYSSGMALIPDSRDLFLGVTILAGSAALIIWQTLRREELRTGLSRAAVLAAGVALAWKEGFVRPDVHVIVLFVYGFFLAALLPALMSPKTVRPASELPGEKPSSLMTVNPHGSDAVLCASAAMLMIISLAPFVVYRKAFANAVQTELLPRFSDTLASVFAPSGYASRLQEQFDAMRERAELPRIRSRLGQEPVAVLGLDQHVAILNKMKYQPHPVFQNYCAYTPRLQQLNSVFFESSAAPRYILWRQTVLDDRFPTLDDGEVLLKILSSYTPVDQEKGFVLWQRDGSPHNAYAIGPALKVSSHMDEWTKIPNGPIWVRVNFSHTLFGKLQNLVRASPEVRLETQLANGNHASYRLLPGNGKHGFLLSPVVSSALDMRQNEESECSRAYVVAARLTASNKSAFAKPVEFTLQTVTGITHDNGPALLAQHPNAHEN